ncbi:MAG: hypothetical protein FWC79_03290 [Oscillospiraceae bacterium]|nr:hypothetical protein [Oscillospiraceae bacterium]
MRKVRVLTLLLFVITVVFFAACGRGNSGAVEAREVMTQEEMYDLIMSFVTGDNPSFGETIEEEVNAFTSVIIWLVDERSRIYQDIMDSPWMTSEAINRIFDWEEGVENIEFLGEALLSEEAKQELEFYYVMYLLRLYFTLIVDASYYMPVVGTYAVWTDNITEIFSDGVRQYQLEDLSELGFMIVSVDSEYLHMMILLPREMLQEIPLESVKT